MRHLSLPLAAVGLLVVAGLASAATVCGVEFHRTTLGSWKIDSFYEPGTSNPLSVDLTVTAGDPGADIEVFDGSSWAAASIGVTYPGTKLRVRNGSATTTFAYSGCTEEIQTDD